jgi:prophage regulatory protein
MWLTLLEVRKMVNHGTSKVLRILGVIEKIGMSRSTIYNKLTPTSKSFDETFPKPIRLGASSVGWLESEIDSWIAARAQARGVVAERGGHE